MRFLCPFLFALLAAPALALTARDLQPGADYDPGVPAPSAFFPVEVAERHLRHDQLVAYLRTLAEASPRVSLERIGRTHEYREQVLLAISHPDNLARLDELREEHLAYLNGASDDPGPLVVWLGYSIHGNEASGANAAPLVAYHLAAERAAEAWLRDVIILVDPALNPDGIGRFAHWVNMHKGYAPMADPVNREHVEHWPGGRFNHYWFDLNRDWLPLVHPESRNRVRVFQRWRPHVFADFHEMGSDSTYFFQPGVPERRNPLTPERNVELTEAIARFHAQALEEVDQLFFTEERFDDFYYGKGSTYPDVQGSVGILFEQGSVRAHLRDSANGRQPFAWAVRNQFLTSLSTVAGARAIAGELQSFQRAWVADAPARARAATVAGYVFGSGRAAHRTRAMAERLAAHGIEVFRLAADVTVDDRTFLAGEAWFAPVDQPQTTLLQALFETRTTFEDSTFYDVSAWTFPLAFGVPSAGVTHTAGLAGAPFGETEAPAVEAPPAGAYAYLVPWDHDLAPRALARLQAAGLPVRVATEPFTATLAAGDRPFERGTLLVARGLVGENTATLDRTIRAVATDDGVPVFAVERGLTPRGIDLGSNGFRVLDPVRPILVTGEGVSPPDAGEVWHLLDTRVGLAPALVDGDRLARVELDDYTHLLLVGGRYDDWPDALVDRLRRWVAGGGVLVATQDAAAWVTRQALHGERKGGDEARAEPASDHGPAEARPYAAHEDDVSGTVIGGAIVRATVDISHPLAYGYHEPEVALFRRGTVFLAPSRNPYETPLRYPDEPLVAGYLGEARRAQLAGSAAAIASRVGGGTVIRFADNPNFRGFWFGTNKLYLNALFFGAIIDRTLVPDTETRL